VTSPKGSAPKQQTARSGLGGDQQRFRYKQVPDELWQWTTWRGVGRVSANPAEPSASRADETTA
jgi:hypothetical protein